MGAPGESTAGARLRVCASARPVKSAASVTPARKGARIVRGISGRVKRLVAALRRRRRRGPRLPSAAAPPTPGAPGSSGPQPAPAAAPRPGHARFPEATVERRHEGGRRRVGDRPQAHHQAPCTGRSERRLEPEHALPGHLGAAPGLARRQHDEARPAEVEPDEFLGRQRPAPARRPRSRLAKASPLSASGFRDAVRRSPPISTPTSMPGPRRGSRTRRRFRRRRTRGSPGGLSPRPASPRRQPGPSHPCPQASRLGGPTPRTRVRGPPARFGCRPAAGTGCRRRRTPRRRRAGPSRRRAARASPEARAGRGPRAPARRAGRRRAPRRARPTGRARGRRRADPHAGGAGGQRSRERAPERLGERGRRVRCGPAGEHGRPPAGGEGVEAAGAAEVDERGRRVAARHDGGVAPADALPALPQR